MPHGTLANLANSAFVRTPPRFSERIVRGLLSFPQGKTTTVLDPTAGEGDPPPPCREIPLTWLSGVEIRAELPAAARPRLPPPPLAPRAVGVGRLPKRNR